MQGHQGWPPTLAHNRSPTSHLGVRPAGSDHRSRSSALGPLDLLLPTLGLSLASTLAALTLLLGTLGLALDSTVTDLGLLLATLALALADLGVLGWGLSPFLGRPLPRRLFGILEAGVAVSELGVVAWSTAMASPSSWTEDVNWLPAPSAASERRILSLMGVGGVTVFSPAILASPPSEGGVGKLAGGGACVGGEAGGAGFGGVAVLRGLPIFSSSSMLMRLGKALSRGSVVGRADVLLTASRDGTYTQKNIHI